MKNYLICS